MAKIYVSTYKKYNEGNLEGEWVNLEDFNDAEEFFEYIAELHKDEEDPEFMFQDFEDVPDKYQEESLNEDEVQEIYDYINNFDDHEKTIIEEYWDEVDDSVEPDKILEYYCGEMSGEEYAQEMCEDCYNMSDVPDFIKYHIDWDGVWRDMSYEGYEETTNYIFDTNR